MISSLCMLIFCRGIMRILGREIWRILELEMEGKMVDVRVLKEVRSISHFPISLVTGR